MQFCLSNAQFPFVRSIPPNATAAQVQEAAKVLSANRFEEDFGAWFLPVNPRGRGLRNLQELADQAAEFLLDLFISVRQNLGGSFLHISHITSPLLMPLWISEVCLWGMHGRD